MSMIYTIVGTLIFNDFCAFEANVAQRQGGVIEGELVFLLQGLVAKLAPVGPFRHLREIEEVFDLLDA
jgi:hypothetical protein